MLDQGLPVDMRIGTFGQTVLQVSANLGHTEAVKMLLERGADPNQADLDGATVLSYAAEQSRSEVIDLLLAAGAEPNRCQVERFHPLLLAIKQGHEAVVDRLLSGGADPEQGYAEGYRPLHMALHFGRIGMARKLVRAGADPDRPSQDGIFPTLMAFHKTEDFFLELFEDWPLPRAVEPQYGHSCLMVAVELGWRRAVPRLLDLGADPNFMGKSGESALLMAVAMADEEMVACLLAGGADPNLAGPEGRWPLFVAVARGHEAIVDRLIERGARLDVTGPDGISLLGFALSLEDPGLFLKLLDAGADPHASLPSGKNLLFLAASTEHVSATIALLANGLPADEPADDGMTPLMAAARALCPTQVERLVRQGGAEVDRLDQEGFSALMHAVAVARSVFDDSRAERLLATIDVLLAAGASLETGADGSAPLARLAARCATRALFQRLLEAGMRVDPQDAELFFEALENTDRRVLDLILSMGGPLESRNAEGLTPLLAAARFGQAFAVRRLVSAGADLHAVSPQGRGILHCAVEGDAPEILAMALKRGAAINRKDDDGYTPLALAAELGGLELARTLLKAKADKALTDGQGRTPRQIALVHRDKPMARLLA